MIREYQVPPLHPAHGRGQFVIAAAASLPVLYLVIARTVPSENVKRPHAIGRPCGLDFAPALTVRRNDNIGRNAAPCRRLLATAVGIYGARLILGHYQRSGVVDFHCFFSLFISYGRLI